MLLIEINRKNGVPFHKQITNKIIDLIELGVLAPGTVMPSTRELGQRMQLNRSTIYRAYQELWTLGYIESRPGSYTTVRNRVNIIKNKSAENRGIMPWDGVLSKTSSELHKYHLDVIANLRSPGKENIIDFSRLYVDNRLFPVNDFRRCLNASLIHEGQNLLGYGDEYGLESLRENIAHRMQIHGINVGKDNILITNGSQQALDLIIRIFELKGKNIVVESPTYFDLFPLLMFSKAKIIEVPMTDQGMDLEILKKRIAANKVAFIYTIPNFHNPTGITTSQAHREKLLKIAEQNNIPIIEDGFEEEMKYYGKVILPVKSMDKNQLVIYLGTFSKALFAGIRIGWIVADTELIKRISSLKKYSDLGVNAVNQAALNKFCQDGYYDLHIKRIHRIYRKRMSVALNEIQKHFPQTAKWTKPSGGYTIWVTLDKDYNVQKFNAILEKNKVSITHGKFFYYKKNDSNNFRISIARLNEDEIRTGIERLGKSINELLKKRKDNQ